MEDKPFIKPEIRIHPKAARVLGFILRHYPEGEREIICRWVGQVGPLFFDDAPPRINPLKMANPFVYTDEKVDSPTDAFLLSRAHKPTAT